MKPHGVDVQISMLIASVIMFWLGKFAMGVYSANTGWQPQTWWSEALWGIVPAAPFMVVFLIAASLWIIIAVSDWRLRRRSKNDPPAQ
jgi:hypothetical protein